MLRSWFGYYFGILGFGIALIMIAQGGQAQAAQELVLTADQSQVINLPEAPATVVVGNPSIADVTTDGRSLFFHPRGFGLTNVLALDANGRKLGDYLVRVIFEDRYSVSMYSPFGRQTYDCRKDCEPTLRIGDNAVHLSLYKDQADARNTLASNQAMGEDMLVPRTVTLSPYGMAPP